jgi:adenylate kinase
MKIALTGTPGTGKTSISKLLEKKGFNILDLNRVACEKNFIIGKDDLRDSNIIDIEKFDDFFITTYKGKDIIIEGHLSHLLSGIDKIIILRCHPDYIKKNLKSKGWKKEKIRENIEAEILDIILCEAVDKHSDKNIFEIDVTGKSIEFIASSIVELINSEFKNMKNYKIGKIDWSEEILKKF